MIYGEQHHSDVDNVRELYYPDQINSAVGNNADKEKKLALALLHGAIGAKKKGIVWTKQYEQLMKRHLELCVDLKDHRMAKDGLHQYRNLCQSVSVINLIRCCFFQVGIEGY